MKTLTICIQAIIWTITRMTGFRCFSNVGHTPSLKPVIKNVSMVATALRISAIECALLCKARSCISLAYDPATQQCFTKNVNVGQNGLLCGTAVDQAREICKVGGEAYVAYGGKKYTTLQCVCGINAGGGSWALQSSTTSYNCIDTCTSNSGCLVKFGFKEPCVLCKGTLSSCNFKSASNVKVSVCTKIT